MELFLYIFIIVFFIGFFMTLGIIMRNLSLARRMQPPYNQPYSYLQQRPLNIYYSYPPATQNITRTIVEKEIIKIRCQHCNSLFEETLDKCPYCGGR